MVLINLGLHVHMLYRYVLKCMWYVSARRIQIHMYCRHAETFGGPSPGGEAIWNRCTLSFRSLFVDMVHDLIIGSNEQYSWSISGMQPKVHVLNSDADLVFVYVQTESLVWSRFFEFFGEDHDLFPVLQSVHAWK